ncbi:MAG: NAD-dependent epimerase/dehydratase family protein [Solirubrobacteraceae bacterium]
MGPKVLVTGGAGFIGSHLVRRLVERGDRVRVLDDLSTGRRDRLAGLAADVDFIEGDLRSPGAVRRAVRGCDLVFHQGALPSVSRSLDDPIGTTAVIVEGTLNVLRAARDEGVRRVVLASSSSVYGDAGELPRVESARLAPISPYATAKLAAEGFCASFGRDGAPETVVLRYFNVFGPGQDPHSRYAAVVPRFILALAAGEPLPVYGDGRQSRDFTYVADVVEANLLAAGAQDVNGAVLNVSGGRARSVVELAEAIGVHLRRAPRLRHLPARPGEVRESWADLTESRRRLGYEPQTTLEEGLGPTIEAMIARPPDGRPAVRTHGRMAGVCATALTALTLVVTTVACGRSPTADRAAPAGAGDQRAHTGPFVTSTSRDRAVVWAVGDGGNGSQDAKAVASLIASSRFDRLLYVGDVYTYGTAQEYRSNYGTTYGPLARVTAPTPGDNEWPRRAAGYDAYWARVHGRPTPPYYSFRVGEWKILSLNSEVAHGPGSPQLRWLASEVRGPGTCRLVFWHRPRRSAGTVHGDQPDVAPLWNAVRGHAVIVLNGHEHDMQRLRPIDGITELVSGAGGAPLYRLDPSDRRVAFGDDTHFGALRLELVPERARFAFIRVGGQVLDSGIARCSPRATGR